MTTGEALKIVENYGNSWGYPGLLETLEGMMAAKSRNDLFSSEETALKIVWNGLTEFFNVEA